MQQSSNQMGPQQATSLPQVKGPHLNDRDRINDILATQKYLSNGYNVATYEASTDELYQLQLQCLNEVHQASRELFLLMNQKGWYKLEAADQNKISQKSQQFSNYRTQFPYS
ncbi:spore coat protein [Thermoactinomyces mirandus]|uniref:Spore coat protein n=1 Tax=Thermoactinomyces mirandus TaxID=2756294 RepID=A0A7W2ARM6_9BACL|nr:spore coat protein [Thermoactinomyces mirandus]MBA4602768.1 spore coat protein [Thermoactinomyces mirandus]